MERQEIPDYIGTLVEGLPGAGLNYRRVESEIISSGGSVPLAILRAVISRPGEKKGYVVLAEGTLGHDNEYSLVIQDPADRHHYVFATPEFAELSGLPPDVVCGAKGRFTKRLLEDIFAAANDKSSPDGDGMNLIRDVVPTLANLPFLQTA